MASYPLVIFFCLLSGIEDSAIVFNDTKQLFLDDYLIESTENITREIHPAEKYSSNPILWPDKDWEGNVALLYGSVIKDNGAYRMWYYGSPGVLYAESDDGIVWKKPQLGIVEVDDSPTNIVISRNAKEGEANNIPFFYELFGVFKDSRELDPLSRYKMGFLSIQRDYKGPREDPYHRGSQRGFGVALSADGIHWRLHDNWATEAICDGGTYWMFDPRMQCHVLFGRTKFVPPGLLDAWPKNDWVDRYFWGRASARVESSDFLNWKIKDPGQAPIAMAPDIHDPPGTEIYSMHVFPYGSVTIGLVQVFHNQPDACSLDIQLAVSRDGVTFQRVGNRKPFIPLGPVGEWDRFNTSVANNPPIEDGDKLRFYYSGRTYRHSPYHGKDKGESGGGIGFAAIKRDRFVSLSASFDSGKIVTKPLTLHGDDLHINAKSDFGEITIEAFNPSGDCIAKSKPIRSDRVDILVEWEQGNLNDINTPIQLRITLKNARVFAIWIQ